MVNPYDTKKEMERAIDEALFQADGQGHTRFGREVHDAVFEDGSDGSPSRFQRELKKGFYQTFGKWFFGGGAVLLVSVAGLYYQVQEHEEKLEQAGQYTEADAIEDGRIQESRDTRQDENIQALRAETTESLRDIENKLDQLIQRLIP